MRGDGVKVEVSERQRPVDHLRQQWIARHQHSVDGAVQAVLGPGPDLIQVAGEARELGFPTAPEEGRFIEILLDDIRKGSGCSDVG